MILIAANPYRGAAGPRARVEALVAALEAAGAGSRVRVVWDAAARAAFLADPGAMADVRCVVAAGGDGTVAAVLNELPTDVPLAVLPTGNENLFARALGFAVAPARLARAILAGGRRRLDLGRASTTDGTRRFGLMLSTGFDADVIHRVTSWRERGGGPRQVGRTSYVRHIGAALWAYAPAPLAVTADDLTTRAFHCVIGNLPDYAVALRLTPAARADDGLLDWTTFQRGGRAALTAYAWAVLLRRHVTLSHVRTGRARRLRVTSEVPVPVQLDGEAAGFTPVEVEVLPAALSLVVV